MDVVFVQLPRYKRNPNKRIQPQLGIAYIASYLLQKGLQVSIVDGEVDDLTIDRIVEQIRDIRPMAVGITTPTEDRFHAFELAAKLKAYSRDVLVFAGGPHFTYSAQDALEHLPEIDVVVMGEGELASFELLKAFERDRSVHAFHHVKGCAFRDENGQIIVTPKRDVIMALDELPMPAWHLYDMDKYHGTLSVEETTRAVGIISSRGCPFRCVFCSNSLNRKVRYRNPRLFVDEIEFLKERYGFPGVNIQDDSFTANPRHVLGICEEILRRGLKIRWYSSLRVDNVTNDLLLLMKEAGCVALGYGIETGSERLLKLIKKGITTDQIRNAIKITRQVGFKHVWLFTMTSLPGQTREDIRISSEFLSEMLSILRGRPVREVFIGGPTLIYPGTETELIAKRNGNIFDDNFSWNTYYETNRAKVLKSNQFVPHFENPGLSLEDIYADAVALTQEWAQEASSRPPATGSKRCFQGFMALMRKADETRHLLLNSCRRISLLLRISLKRWKLSRDMTARTLMFILSEETLFSFEVPQGSLLPRGNKWVSWMEMPHTTPGRLGLVLLAGARVRFGPFQIKDAEVAYITFGAALPEISADGMEIIVRLKQTHGESGKGNTGDGAPIVYRHHIREFDPEIPWQECRFALDPAAGKTGTFFIECGPGPQNDPCADWLAIYEFVVCREEMLSLSRARAFRRYRIKNEISVFTQRQNKLLETVENRQINPELTAEDLSSVDALFERSRTTGKLYGKELAGFVRTSGSLAKRLLEEGLKKRPPDFKKRLHKKLAESGKLRVLSLCSGSGSYEEQLIAGIPSACVQLTLVDINPHLIELAEKRLRQRCRVEAIVSDVNELELNAGRFDVIFCVSGLHHVVELERLMRTIHNALIENGELWSIAEYVGRNGNRLWPDAYDAANDFFTGLPRKYRVNHATSIEPHLDEKLPNFDCSVNSFEGIRSDDIEFCLKEHFSEIEADKRSCFLWRLFNTAYAANYDIHAAEDVTLIEEAVWREVRFHRNGGRATSLYGIFGRKNQCKIR